MYEENIVVNLLVCQSGFWNLSSMDEEATSWIRRTKFSHTVCHRMDPSLLSSSLPLRANRVSWTKIGREATLAYQRSVSNVVEVHNNPTNNKVRTVSPLPELRLPETFSEARSNQKRFSTPSPRRRDSEKSALTKFFNRDTKVTKSFSETKSSTREVKFQRNARSLPHSTSLKPNEKSKTQKESSGWSKYFDHNGGRVSSVETLDEQFEVDLSKLFLGLRFAHGAHSQLYRGKYKDEPVAVKIIRFPDDDENGSLCSRFEKQFTREVTLLSRLRHQNVLKFVAACQKPPVLCIITEYLPLGSLRSYLHKLEEKPLPLQKLLSMALEIARGMEYIHSMGVIHRDLKPENILITEDFHLKVADFGIACEENSCDVISDDPGTYRWMAPEMIDRKHYKNYGRKVDVYGFGLILWEFVAGTIPYEDMTPIQAAYAVVTKKLRPVVPPHCPPVMKILIEQCWSSRPERRPEFQQIVKVLEELESRFSRDGSLDLVPKSILQDILKGQFHYNQKLGASNKTPPRANPKFL